MVKGAGRVTVLIDPHNLEKAAGKVYRQIWFLYPRTVVCTERSDLPHKQRPGPTDLDRRIPHIENSAHDMAARRTSLFLSPSLFPQSSGSLCRLLAPIDLAVSSALAHSNSRPRSEACLLAMAAVACALPQGGLASFPLIPDSQKYAVSAHSLPSSSSSTSSTQRFLSSSPPLPPSPSLRC